MKTQTIVEAKRNRKPFITEGKKYELIEEVNAGYKIVNDLGKVAVENHEDFYHNINKHQYGFKLEGGIIPGFGTPFIGIIKEDDEISFGGVLFFVGFVVSYTFKRKLK